MGEYADYSIDDYMDAFPEWVPIRQGIQYRVCKYCGQKGLQWKWIDSGWRLTDLKGLVHSCEKYSSK